MSTHRALGVLGAVIAFAMLWSGSWVTAFGINLQSALGFPFEARAQALSSVMKIFFFAACVALAVTRVRTPNVHKRLAIIFCDRRATGRSHPVYMIGLIVLIAMQILRIPVGSTQAWQTAAGWLATFSS